MDQIFLNAYIEKINKKLEEAWRQNILLEVQLELSNQLNSELRLQKAALEDKIEAELNKKKKKSEPTNEF